VTAKVRGCRKKRVILCVISILAVLICAGSVFFSLHLWIPRSLQLQKLVQHDVFYGGYMQLSAGAKLYDITDIVFYESDTLRQESRYCITVSGTESAGMTAYLTYPGTPSRQYYGYPRLRDSMRLMIIADPEDLSDGELGTGYILFRIQEIDGEEYAYPLYMSDSLRFCSVLGDRIPFRYTDESQIYDTWYDADVLAHCQKIGWKNPEYVYKLKLSDLLENYTKILYGSH